MKKLILLIAIIFAACAEQNQDPKTAGYFIQDEEQSYMIGSDETTEQILETESFLPAPKKS